MSVAEQKWTTKSRQVFVVAGLFFLAVNPSGLPTLAQSSMGASSPPINSSVRSTETDYTLGAGDRLRVDIFGVPEFSGEYLVVVDGTLGLPLVGRMDVAGLTIPQMSQMVSEGYAQYLKRPVITVSLLSPRPLKLAIAGEVNSPGSYNINLNETGKFPSVTDLIQQAGGLTAAADIGEVRIRRSLNGREQTVAVDLWQLLSQGNLNQDITLRDGDTVIIPTQEVVSAADTRQLADASFGIQSNLPVNVAVVGEVYRPGSYLVKPEQIGNGGDTRKALPPRVTQAIAQAGGIRPLADIRDIQVRRETRSGSQEFDVNLWQLLRSGDTSEDIILQEGDTIIIPTAENVAPSEAESLASASFSPQAIRVNVVGEVEKPGTVEIPPNTPLNQALLSAGGFNDQRAKRSTVELIRLNPNGTVSKREIPVDLSAGINEETNPLLRNNDVVIVDRSGLARVSDTLGSVLSPVGSAFSLFRFLNFLGL